MCNITIIGVGSLGKQVINKLIQQNVPYNFFYFGKKQWIDATNSIKNYPFDFPSELKKEPKLLLEKFRKLLIAKIPYRLINTIKASNEVLVCGAIGEKYNSFILDSLIQFCIMDYIYCKPFLLFPKIEATTSQWVFASNFKFYIHSLDVEDFYFPEKIIEQITKTKLRMQTASNFIANEMQLFIKQIDRTQLKNELELSINKKKLLLSYDNYFEDHIPEIYDLGRKIRILTNRLP